MESPTASFYRSVPSSPLSTKFPAEKDRGRHGSSCNCKFCLLKRLDYRGPSEWWRQEQDKWGPKRLPVDYRIMNAKLSMLKDDLYIPNVFHPERYSETWSKFCVPQDLFHEYKLSRTTYAGDESRYRFALQRHRCIGPNFQILLQLIYVDGACVNNGQADAYAGLGFAYSNCTDDRVSLPLPLPEEEEKKTATTTPHTSNRAELWAVCKALEWKNWHEEECEAIVIATDSTYVVDCATIWISSWIENGWCTSGETKVANQDLWERILKRVGELALSGCETMFWQIPREENIAKALARQGATMAWTGGGSSYTYGKSGQSILGW